MASYRFTAALARMVDEERLVVTRAGLFADGFRDYDIEDGVARDLLSPVFAGTYVVGRKTLTQSILRQAATVHAVPAMVLGRSAAEHLALLTARDGVVTVGTERRGLVGSRMTKTPMASTGKPGLVIYREAADVAPEVVERVPTSPVPRMLVDIAAAENHSMLERVWKQADYRGLLDLETVARELEKSRRGTPSVRALLRKHPGSTEAAFNTPHEVDFLQLIKDAGLPLPEVNAPMNLGGDRSVADYFYVELGLVVELDDPSHDRPLARQSDALRDAVFYDANLDVIRFDTRSVAIDPAASMQRLNAVIELHRRRLGLT